MHSDGMHTRPGSSAPWYHRWKPGSSRNGLLRMAAVVWGLAGGVLLLRGYLLLPDTLGDHIVLGNLGIFAGIIGFRFLFNRLTERTIGRIRTLAPDRPCLFSFQSWRSYGLMSVMMSAGVWLRSAGVLPAAGVGTLYIAMGVPLLVSSGRLAFEGVRNKKEAVRDRALPAGIGGRVDDVPPDNHHR